ncbi:acyl-CoA dehydrogenase family protein [Rhodococcus sp. BP-252]|uniref:Acyl-CoA dehydrogenase n=1 Tax=Rhodococcoides kyotonense TaxID=398843 RepID=A0A177YK68_9NOCA|nr:MULTISPECIES: acyl-CoA dehydrogenase family protein [Rhodococcus]MBY6413212.1 acyl-CoA dehydrogenase family protein [Rhodococcus sp. BP-320]MBY6418691.1 acyl-CoA dehydrogenase family protein [Rhodococcus sp. BP-321]MBY6422985.1 acyl-CoA dehydrogenase family protein [Rhodococcus sp. BP-324]MBY6427955.1 acyl-CoA dehydrogenase family protein [Rhodococcus sp. BP-323]MBY6433133.1 acyl-CoA dehydrogenase family protein [Rhodococcus sp. BP-322]
MTIATTEDQRDAQKSVRSWVSRTTPIVTLRADETAAWRTSWRGLEELGVFSVAVPDDAGGAGGTVVDLAAMVEEIGAGLVGGPVVATAVSAIVGAGDGPCALVLPPERATSRSQDGVLVLDGQFDVVSGLADGVDVLVLASTDAGERWCLVAADAPGVKVEVMVGVDRSTPVGRLTLTAAPARVVRDVDVDHVRDLAVTLYAAEAAGVAGWCLRTAVDHAKTREQFGAAIGSFQAIKHLCADMLCRVEQARAAAWDAAVAADTDTAEFALAAAVAAAVCVDAAVATAEDCIQVLGGIGFTWEHDAHFYLRRALSLRQLLGGASWWRRRVTELSRAGVRRQLAVDLGDTAEVRDAVRVEVDAISRADDPRVALAESGLAAPHWPSPYGRDAGAAEQLLVAEELASAGLSAPDLVIGWWAVPTILEHGTAEQIDRFARPTLRGDITWCQLFSEPEAGSDLASLRTTATQVDGGWRLRGHKIWTSLARDADWAICLARTDRDAPKHKGIGYFLVDMRTPGIRIEPLREITGDAVFNEVFLDDVVVPDDCLVGRPGDGWRFARTTLANERVAMSSGSALGSALEDAITATNDADDAVLGDRLGGLIAEGQVGSVLELRTALRRLGGQDPGPESSVAKLVGVVHRQDLAEFALEAAGRAGAVEGPLAKEMLLTRCLSIAGGTTQILKTVAAERILGLPR